jgi:hypothetical protein
VIFKPKIPVAERVTFSAIHPLGGLMKNQIGCVKTKNRW